MGTFPTLMAAAGALLILLVPGARAETIDDELAAARAHVLSPEAPLDELDRAERLDSLDHCIHSTFDAAANPERAGTLDSVLGRTKAQSLYHVLNYQGGATSSAANEGIKNWMRASATSDCRFFRAARIFLQELERRDKAAGLYERKQRDRLVPIQDAATFDVQEIARSAVRQAFDGARDDVYLSMKVMSLYGHDNLNNQLTMRRWDSGANKFVADGARNRCEYAILDAYKPVASSTLYRNGAIRGLSYSARDVAEGQALAAACPASCARLGSDELRGLCFYLCNDELNDYQADYYHVVAAGYLVCEATLDVNRSRISLGMVALGGAQAVADVAFDHGGYALTARKYKKDRLRENYRHLEDAPLFMRVVEKSLDDLPARSDARAICASHRWSCTDADLAAAQAIIDRYAFEVAFRERQHELGQHYADQQCSNGRATLEHPLCAP